MFLRSLISLLIIASLGITTTGRSIAKQEETSGQVQEAKLTPEEEREARALAEEFIERMEKSGDVTSLVKDLYVGDFTERLRERMNTIIPLAATPEVAAQMSSDEILRAYTASINCIYLASRLFVEFEKKREQERAKRGETSDLDESETPMISEIIPPNIIKLIQSDPLLAALLDEEIREEKEERRSSDSERDVVNASTSEANANETLRAREPLDDIWPFKSLDQMRHYTSLLEQGVKLLREHIDSLPPQLRPSVLEFMSTSGERSNNDEANEPEDKLKLRTFVLEDEFMGYSSGTQIICANALIFHVDMVRGTDGYLKLLNVYVMMD